MNLKKWEIQQKRSTFILFYLMVLHCFVLALGHFTTIRITLGEQPEMGVPVCWSQTVELAAILGIGKGERGDSIRRSRKMPPDTVENFTSQNACLEPDAVRGEQIKYWRSRELGADKRL